MDQTPSDHDLAHGDATRGHPMADSPDPHDRLQHERWTLLNQINTFTETPLVMLSFVWLGLLVIDFTQGLSPFLQTLSTVIWGIFVADFIIEIVIAPHKGLYLRRHWLTAVSLLLPALRVFRLVRVVRVLRAARATRSLGLVRLVTSLNRGMGALSRLMGRRGVGYVLILTTLVTFAGAAGMYFFEQPTVPGERGLDSYGEAVWWTAMIMTTMGSEYWPHSGEGRILGWLLSLYAFAIFGYITATIASYFVGQERAAPSVPTPDAHLIAALRYDIALLQVQLQALTFQHTPASQDPDQRPDGSP